MSETVLADIQDGKIVVTCESFSNKDLTSLIPGAKWREANGHWSLNLTWASAKQLRNLHGENLELSDALMEWGLNELNNRIEPCMLMRGVLDPSDYPDIEYGKYDSRLYPYQVAGAQFLTVAKNAILADSVGAGKSATSISAAKELGTLPALVIAPKSTLISWQREIEMWWPGVPVYVVYGTREQRAKTILQAIEEPCFVVINWEAVRLHSRLAPYGSTRMRHCVQCDKESNEPWAKCERCPKELNMVDWDLVIVDEGHRLSNAQSKQSRAIHAIGQGLGRNVSPNYRWVLTGTPMTNQLDSLYSALHFLAPEEHPSRVAFIDYYCLTRIVPWGSGSEVIGINPYNEEEFQEIFQPRFRRMPKEIILPQLPPIVRTQRRIPMSPQQRRCYEEMAEDMVAETESGELLIAANPAVKMLRMVQFSSALVDMVPVLDEGGIATGELVARLTDPSNKLDALMDDLPDLLEAGESVVVFAVSRQLIEMAEARLTKAKIKHSVIKGNQKPAFRQSQIDAFQSGEVPVVLVVISAGGTGVNLFKGRIGIFLQRAWDFVSNHQGEGRLHRIGSEVHDTIEIIDYISEGTADEAVVQVARGKELKLEEIVRDAEAIRNLLYGRIED